MTKEEAIEVYKGLINTKIKEAFEFFAPELKESEDERIRKEMIHWLKGFIGEEEGCGYTEDEIRERIAYLEKQKEPIDPFDTKLFQDGVKEGRRLEREDIKKELSPIPDKFSGLKSLMLQYLQSATNRKDDIEIENDTDLWGRKILDYVWKYSEKLREQNGENEECTDFTIYHPLKNGKGEYECIPYSFYGSLTSFSEDKDLIDFLRTCFYTEEECNEWIEQQKEQKPNIEICPHSIKSKSYKENGYPIENCDYGLEIAYDILEKTFGEVRGYQTDDGIREHQTAIEAVRKAKEQKPAEWNEEDENNLELVIDCIYKFYPDPVMKYKLKEWLKSLRPTKDCSDCAKHLKAISLVEVMLKISC